MKFLGGRNPRLDGLPMSEFVPSTHYAVRDCRVYGIFTLSRLRIADLTTAKFMCAPRS
jgi:hypothetical protein